MLLESGPPPDCHIERPAEGSKDPVGEFGFAMLAIGIVRHDNKQVEIAVRHGFASGLRTKKPDGLGSVGVNKPHNGIMQ